MKFNIVVIDPPSGGYAHFLFDGIRTIQFGLESLGHDCIISKNNLDPSRMNLICAAHQINDAETVRQIIDYNVPYIVLQSELLHDGIDYTFGSHHWKQCYLPLMRGATRVWDWSQRQCDDLATLDVAADHIIIGYHPHLEEIHHKKTKSIDVLWYGSITPHRAEILRRITERQVSVVRLFDDVAFYRNDYMARAKIILTLQQRPDSHLPYWRVVHATTNRCLVAGEAASQPHWAEALYRGATAQDVPDLIFDLLHSHDRDAIVEQHVENAKKHPMTELLAPLVDRLP
jgi:hypothetical protein